MARPCTHARKPSSYDPANCRACWWCAQPASPTAVELRRLWGEPEPACSPGPCRHRGAATGERVLCPTCQGKVELKLFACGLHGRCTTHKPAPGLACCGDCPDYDPGAPSPPSPAGSPQQPAATP
jgi:hypothetical protein